MAKSGRARATSAVVGLALVATGLSGVGAAPAVAEPAPTVPTGDVQAVSSLDAGRRLTAEIRRTEYGIPHVKADDWAGLGYGYGYAFAEDNVCLLAEEVVTANAERSLVFGASEDNLERDLFHQQLIDLRVVERSLATSPDAPVPGPSPRVRDLVAGTAAGYNRHLRDVGGAAGITDPACADAGWVREIDELDLWRTYLDSAVRAGRGALADEVVSAQPPGASAGPAADEAEAMRTRGLPPVADTDLASNAYGLGREATTNGSGMLLGNPHFPWQGRDRFYEMHLTIPGEYDMIGAALSGQPIVEIGHNETMGWSHTVSTARRFTLYELALVPGNPTQYYVDGQVRDMTSQVVDVQVTGEDGRVATESRTLWSSEYGPIVVVDPLTWSDTTAYALRDVNEDAGRTFDGYIEMGRASSVRELDSVLDTWQHLPWINTVAADSTGEAYYGDHSVVPNVRQATLDACLTPLGQIALDQLGVFILDGSSSGCAWGTDADSRVPGILGPSSLPTIFRDDYVTNSNDSYWLTNPEQPLEGYERIIGVERTARSLRTRLGLVQVQERIDGRDGLEGRGFTLESLQEVMFSNRVYGAELARDDLVALCRSTPSVEVDGAAVELGEACEVLAAWDGRVDLDSRGAHLFRELVAAGGLVWGVPFDPEDPVGTPNTLDTADPAVLDALGTAVARLRDAGVALDARLGDIQTERRGDRVIPIHGGTGGMGAFNVISAPFDSDPADGATGYPDVQSGASFILAAEFTPDGPRSRAILAYSNSTDPTSPHFGDQTELYSEKRWVDLDYHEEDIVADPAYTSRRIEEVVAPTLGRYLEPVFDEVDVVRDLVYTTSVDDLGAEVALTLDLYRPAGDTATRRPAVIWMHGGNFEFGNKGNMELYARDLASRGYVTASINYRLRPGRVGGAAILDAINDATEDARASVRWLSDNAASYGIDGRAISFEGYSAGAVATMNVAYGSDRSAGEDPGIAAAISIAGLQTQGAAEPGEAPLLALHGDEDTVVPYANGAGVCRNANQAGVRCELATYAGDGHLIGIFFAADIADRTAAFLGEEVLGPLGIAYGPPPPSEPLRGAWREGVGRDARGLPDLAQVPGGRGALRSIRGTLGDPNDDDMYRICPSVDTELSARLTGEVPEGAQLFLFDDDGRGIAAAPGRGEGLAGDPALEPGLYHLAISRNGNDPLGAEGALFPADRSGRSEPISDEVVVDWSDGDTLGSSGPSPYRIELTGAAVCAGDSGP